jgi:hypothetical protein
MSGDAAANRLVRAARELDAVVIHMAREGRLPEERVYLLPPVTSRLKTGDMRYLDSLWGGIRR